MVCDTFDAVFYPGGHGPLWDLAENLDSIGLIESTYAAGKPVAAVCHAPAVFRHAKGPNGTPLVQGKSVTGFTNTEEAAVGLTDIVPFLVEDMLKANGGRYSKQDDWQRYAITDGNLVTGQNPASSADAAARCWPCWAASQPRSTLPAQGAAGHAGAACWQQPGAPVLASADQRTPAPAANYLAGPSGSPCGLSRVHSPHWSFTP